MIFITGDDVGLIKSSTVVLPEETGKSHKERTKMNPISSSTITTASLTSSNTINRDLSIEKIVRSNIFIKNVVLVARSSGMVEYLSLMNETPIASVQIPIIDVKKEKIVFIIDLPSNHLLVLTSLGRLYMFLLSCNHKNIDINSEIDLESNLFSLISSDSPLLLNGHSSIQTVDIYPYITSSSIFLATAGLENAPSIWCITLSRISNGFINLESQKDISSFNFDNISNQNKLNPIWISKNVPHDFLDIRVPIDNASIKFLSMESSSDNDTTKNLISLDLADSEKSTLPSGFRLLSASKKHKLRFYRPSQQRKPVMDIDVGENIIKAMSVLPDETACIFSDNMGNIFMFDLVKKQIIGGFKSSSGTITDLWIGSPSEVENLYNQLYNSEEVDDLDNQKENIDNDLIYQESRPSKYSKKSSLDDQEDRISGNSRMFVNVSRQQIQRFNEDKNVDNDEEDEDEELEGNERALGNNNKRKRSPDLMNTISPIKSFNNPNSVINKIKSKNLFENDINLFVGSIIRDCNKGYAGLTKVIGSNSEVDLKQIISDSSTGNNQLEIGSMMIDDNSSVNGDIIAGRIKNDKKNNVLITVGMDRYLRVFELEGDRKLLKKIYLKQRLTSITVLP